MTTRRMLRPGWHPVRRDSASLQLGLDAPNAVVVAGTPPVRALLDELAHVGVATPVGGDAVADPACRQALARLETAGVLVDAAALGADRRRHGRLADALYARHGDHAAAVLESRRGTAVAVHGPATATGQARALLDEAGLSADVSTARPGEPDLALVIGLGPVSRELVDPLMRAGTPHLVLEGTSSGVRIGPFVVPGITACLRCVDAHCADPRRPVVLEQLSTIEALPPDPPTWRLALAWAVHELVELVDGGEPRTWSATIDVPQGIGGPPVTWDRHPYCGCAWNEACS